MNIDVIKKEINNGSSCLGIELGSTRVKAVLIGSDKMPVATYSYTWENRFENGIWTYSLEDILYALKTCYSGLKKSVFERYQVTICKLKAIGVSAMMHGLIALDKSGILLTPFVTWRNTFTKEEADELTKLFSVNIPQRWTICHLLYRIKRNSLFLNDIDYVGTLASFVHLLLTGKRVIGIGDASGIFPIDIAKLDYADEKIKIFNKQYLIGKYSFNLRDILPQVLSAGQNAGFLTEKGARLLDEDGDLVCGIPLCPPEGDAGTGMVATNSILPKTGNISAGTSAFAMIVLEKPLKRIHTEIDIVTTPAGKNVAMVHANNCTGCYDEWLSLFSQVLKEFGHLVPKKELYDKILPLALETDSACGGMLSFNYISGESLTRCEMGTPIFMRKPSKKMNLSDFMLSELFSSIAPLRIGIDILREEGVLLDSINCHGGFFKAQNVGLSVTAAVFQTQANVIANAGEGGAWGIALLADFMGSNIQLSEYLENFVFKKIEKVSVKPQEKLIKEFNGYFEI